MTFIFIVIVIVIFFIAAKSIKEREDADKQEVQFEQYVPEKDEIKEQNEGLEKREEKENEITDTAISISKDPFFTGGGGKINMAIKGLFYRNSSDKEAARKLKYGDVIYLRKEVDNEKDPYAVAVYTKDGAHIGYVPREYSMGMTQLLDLGIEPNCMITKRTYHEIPFLYMDVYYKSREQEEMDERLECALVEKFKRLGYKETSILRWELIHKNKPKSYENTVYISAYRNRDLGGFDIKETLESKNKTREISYFYKDNIGRNNYEIAEKLEKGNELDLAIRKYEENIEIEEVIADSAIRLSIIYKKVKQYEKILPMLKAAIEKTNKYGNEIEISKLKERLDMFLGNASFMRKYGNETVL